MSDVSAEMDFNEKIRQLYIRVARDSGFRIDPFDAAKLTAQILGVSPLQVAGAFPYIAVMEQVGRGEHPASRKAAQ